MRPLLSLLLACATLLAGCSDGGGDDPRPTGSMSGSTSQAPMAPPPTTHEVSMEGNAFVPADLTIRVNDTVHWTHNDGNSPHNVESDAPQFDSNPECTIALPAHPSCMTNGDEYSRKFDAAGVVEYRCQVHGGMTGTITVVGPNAPPPS